MDNLVELFCAVDDFCHQFILQWETQLITDGTRKRKRSSAMSFGERMTIMISFHQSNHRDFKNFYIGLVQRYWTEYFPTLISYTRFINTMSELIVPMCAYFETVKGKPTGISFVDSTSLKVCHNIRIPRNKVFAKTGKRGKGTMGWFFGFKLHLLINHQGEILALNISPGNTNDRTPIPDLCRNLTGKLYADKGYIGNKLTEKLKRSDIDLVTTVRKNMKRKVISAFDRAMLSKRYIIETVNGQLKNISQIEHSRHRSEAGFMLNVISGIVAYCVKKQKPRIKISKSELETMAV
ncbi:IS982 family transposase [Psychromonas arctica]|uniref:IS982 family transposase n=1 Tax=Psychromonas arctica TaxID=168275 RepID=A0ABU9HDH9_9GAMM